MARWKPGAGLELLTGKFGTTTLLPLLNMILNNYWNRQGRAASEQQQQQALDLGDTSKAEGQAEIADIFGDVARYQQEYDRYAGDYYRQSYESLLSGGSMPEYRPPALDLSAYTSGTSANRAATGASGASGGSMEKFPEGKPPMFDPKWLSSEEQDYVRRNWEQPGMRYSGMTPEQLSEALYSQYGDRGPAPSSPATGARIGQAEAYTRDPETGEVTKTRGEGAVEPVLAAEEEGENISWQRLLEFGREKIPELGEQRRKDIGTRYKNFGTQVGQNLTQRGLHGTTVVGTMQAGVERQKDAAIGNLDDSLNRMLLDWESNVGSAQLGAKERGIENEFQFNTNAASNLLNTFTSGRLAELNLGQGWDLQKLATILGQDIQYPARTNPFDVLMNVGTGRLAWNQATYEPSFWETYGSGAVEGAAKVAGAVLPAIL